MAKKPVVTVASDSESIISMILGAMVVVVIGALLFSYIKDWRQSKNAGTEVAANVTPEPILTEELPATVTLEKNDKGQDVPAGLPSKYAVKTGDSTWNIALSFYGSGFNYVDIEKENGLAHDQMLTAGQELVIPKVPVRTAAMTAVDVDYTEATGPVGTTQPGRTKGDDTAAAAILK